MVKITYINALGQSITFSNQYPYRLLNVEGLGSLKSKFQTQRSPFQDGETPVDNGHFEKRSMTLYLFVYDKENLQERKRYMTKVLNPKLGNGKLKYEDGATIRVLENVNTRVLPSFATDSENKGVGFQKTAIIFDIFDPFYKDEYFSEIEFITQTDNFEFPLDITQDYCFAELYPSGKVIQNTGDVEAPVEIIMDGPLTAPVELINATLDKKIKVNTSIENGEILTITTGSNNINVLKTDLEGSISNAFEYIDLDESYFWNLVPGNNNVILQSGGSSNENATIKWKNHYVGL